VKDHFERILGDVFVFVILSLCWWFFFMIFWGHLCIGFFDLAFYSILWHCLSTCDIFDYFGHIVIDWDFYFWQLRERKSLGFNYFNSSFFILFIGVRLRSCSLLSCFLLFGCLVKNNAISFTLGYIFCWLNLPWCLSSFITCYRLHCSMRYIRGLL